MQPAQTTEVKQVTHDAVLQGPVQWEPLSRRQCLLMAIALRRMRDVAQPRWCAEAGRR